MLSVQSQLYVHIQKCDTALNVWESLQKLYDDRGLSRKISLLKQLIQSRLEECDGMQDYIDRIIGTSDKLKGVGFYIGDEWIGAILLAGLTDEFKPLIMSIEANGQEIAPDSIVSKLIDVQSSCATTGEAFFAKKNFKKNKNFAKKRQCFICKSTQHLQNECPKRQTGSKDNKREKGNSHAAFCAVGLMSVCSKEDWYVDSGATANMSPFAENLTVTKQTSINEIKCANDARLKVKQMGSGTFKALDGEQITVNDILHIPDISANLLSVYRMVCHGNKVIFDYDGCKIYNKSDKLIASCKPENGVYKLKLIAHEQQCLLTKQEESSAMLWHRRFGHLNFQTMMKLRNSVNGISINDDDSEIKQCKIFPMAKQHREPFKTSETRSTKILELVHSDLCGPMENKSIGGAKYLLTFTDDFSRKTFVYFLKEKSQVLNKMVEFKNMMENQTDCRIKTFRTDNGTEYVTNDFKSFFIRNGIQHQLTCTYTPEQNGVAERANRTIIEKAKCMLLDGKLDVKFWAEACHAAAYLMNRTPRKRLDYKTPEEF